MRRSDNRNRNGNGNALALVRVGEDAAPASSDAPADASPAGEHGRRPGESRRDYLRRCAQDPRACMPGSDPIGDFVRGLRKLAGLPIAGLIAWRIWESRGRGAATRRRRRRRR